MGAGWLTGRVRGRALLSRRVGRAGARELAASGSAAAAVAALAAGPYGRSVHAGQSVAQAERGVAAAVLWHLRVLAGWQPQQGAELVRELAGWFEIANATEHARALAGLEAAPPFELGLLATAWPRLAATTSPAGLRAALAATSWDDPQAGSPAAVAVSMAVSWAARVRATVPEADAWTAGGVALLVARHRFSLGATLPAAVARRVRDALGERASAGPWDEFVAGLRPNASWALAGLIAPDELWRGEIRWWSRVARDAVVLVGQPRAGRDTLLGTVALLAVDAWRVRAALQVAERRGRTLEAFDALG